MVRFEYEFNKDEKRWEGMLIFEGGENITKVSSFYINPSLPIESILGGMKRVIRALDEVLESRN